MGWMVFITLLIFYVLGVWVFRAIGTVRILPLVALGLLAADRCLIWHYRSTHQD
jgi:hypothetical protein